MVNKIALVGLGYIGNIHLKLLLEDANWQVAGVYDINPQITAQIADKYQVKAFSNLEEVFENCQVVNILTPASSHFEIARKAIMAGCHVFTQNPLTQTLKEAKQLQSLANEAGIHLQVSQVERFNPAFAAAQTYLSNARFIEVHRLAQFNQRGNDISVVHDLMLHDIDLVLSLVKANIRRVSASGTPLVNKNNDVVNARLEFDNGTVANLTTNRLAMKNTRKFRVFTDNNFVSINLLDKTTEVLKLQNASPKSLNPVFETSPNLPEKELIFEHPVILPTNAINSELHAFYQGINTGKLSKISIADSIKAMELAIEIEDKILA